MNSSIVRRAKAARLFGFLVMLAGFLPILWFVVQSVLVNGGTGRAPGVLPRFDGWPALEKLALIPHQLHAGLVIAVVGFAVMMLGAALARRQVPVLEAAERQRAEGLRRAAQYDDGERIEPFIGPGLPGRAQVISHQER
jgi:hypothetical protein